MILARAIWYGKRAASGVVGRLLWLVFPFHSTQALQNRASRCYSEWLGAVGSRTRILCSSQFPVRGEFWDVSARDTKSRTGGDVKLVMSCRLEKAWGGGMRLVALR